MKEPNWENWIHLYCYKLGSTVPFRNINKILSQLDVEEVADWLQEQGYEICKSSEPEPPYTGPHNSNKESKREFEGVDRRLLENGMMWGAFRQLLEYKVGVIKIGTEDNDKFRQALEREPEEKLIEAVEYVKNLEKPPMIRYILERIHGYIDQWDYHQGQKQQAPPTLQQQLDKARQELEHFTGDPRYEKSASEQYAIDYVKTVKGEIARLEREVKNAE